MWTPILRARLNSCGLARALAGLRQRLPRCGSSRLPDDLVRVTSLRGREVRQTRTWSVPAFEEGDTDWAGRARLDDSSWPAVATKITASLQACRAGDGALRLTITLDGFRMDWALPDGTIFARDRETQPYLLGQKTHAFKHAMARARRRSPLWLGRQDGPARPGPADGCVARCAASARLRSRATRRSPLQELAVPDRARRGERGLRMAFSTNNGRRGLHFDLGCEHDNYFRPLSRL